LSAAARERVPTCPHSLTGKEADMASIPPIVRTVTGGVDTHQDQHVAAVIDVEQNVLGTSTFPTTEAGYRDLTTWMRAFGALARVGVEGTGCYGAGLHRHLRAQGIEVLEVTRPDRSERRRRGKDDTLDAINAARAARTGQRVATPKGGNGAIESLRVLRQVRTSAVIAHREALQLIHAQIIAAPADLRDQLRTLTRTRLLHTCAAFDPDPLAAADPHTAARLALRSLAERAQHLHQQIRELNTLIEPLVRSLAPSLLSALGFGIHTTAQLLITMGDNPQRMSSEARFAKLCGVAPLPASSGIIQRHRLNRGGDRQANSALHIALINRIHHDQRTRDYIARRTAEGRTKPEIMRCLKRYLAREAYYLIKHDTQQRTPTHGLDT
jgi:transposase